MWLWHVCNSASLFIKPCGMIVWIDVNSGYFVLERLGTLKKTFNYHSVILLRYDYTVHCSPLLLTTVHCNDLETLIYDL